MHWHHSEAGARSSGRRRWSAGEAVIRVARAFIDMMKTDDAASAAAVASGSRDPRLTAFHDPSHTLGRAMARRLGWRHHVAWDTYFVYPRETEWLEEAPPLPETWFHQLRDREAWDQVAEVEVGTADWTTRSPSAPRGIRRDYVASAHGRGGVSARVLTAAGRERCAAGSRRPSASSAR